MANEFPLPLHLIALDVIGTILVGVGLYELFYGSSFLPEALKFNGYETAFIGIGLFLMAPLVLYLAVLRWRLAGSPRVPKIVRRGLLFLVVAYVGYGLLYVSGANVKRDELRSHYSTLHPLLRVASSTNTMRMPPMTRSYVSAAPTEVTIWS